MLNVVVNGEDAGDHVLFLTDMGDILLRPDDIAAMGLTAPPPQTISVGERFSLASMAPDVTFNLNEDEGRLFVMASPKLMPRQVFELNRPSRPDRLGPAPISGFVNYSLDYSRSPSNVEGYVIPLEGGIRMGRGLLLTSLSYSHAGDTGTWRRLDTELTFDDPTARRRLVLGDFGAFFGGLGGGGAFGGASLSSDFTYEPYFDRGPDRYISGVTLLPADVSLYVNGNLVKTEHVHPGYFTFTNIPFAAGAGSSAIVFTDQFGRELSLTEPVYRSLKLLKPGLHDFSYNLGSRRINNDEKFFDYRGLALLGRHRYGIGDAITAEGRLEAEGDMISVGVGADFLMGPKGEAKLDLGISSDSGEIGGAVLFNYATIFPEFKGSLNVTAQSVDYANLSQTADYRNPAVSALATIGYYDKTLGGFTATASYSRRHDETASGGNNQTRWGLYYGRKLWEGVTLSISASRTFADKTRDDLSATLSAGWGTTLSGHVNYIRYGVRSDASATIQRTPPAGIGMGLYIQAETKREENKVWYGSGQTRLQYSGQHGVVSAEYRSYGDTDVVEGRLSGGISFINGDFFVSRPILSSYALITVEGMPGIKVYSGNNYVGTTEGKGEILVANVASLVDNKISLDPNDLPVNFDVEATEQYIYLPYRAGGIVRFAVNRLQAITGKLFFVQGGARRPASLAGLSVTVGGVEIETVVGREGDFFLENISQGRYAARIFDSDRQCSFELAIPDSNDIYINLGEVNCELP